MFGADANGCSQADSQCAAPWVARSLRDRLGEAYCTTVGRVHKLMLHHIVYCSSISCSGWRLRSSIGMFDFSKSLAFNIGSQKPILTDRPANGLFVVPRVSIAMFLHYWFAGTRRSLDRDRLVQGVNNGVAGSDYFDVAPQQVQAAPLGSAGRSLVIQKPGIHVAAAFVAKPGLEVVYLLFARGKISELLCI